MKVLINAASAHMGGAVTYLRNLLKELPEVAPWHQFIVYLPEQTRQELTSLTDQPCMALRPYPFAKTGGITRLWFDQVRVSQLINMHSIDVLFSAMGFGTFFSPCPQALLVRNSIYFDEALQARYRKLGRSLRENTLRRWWSLLSIRAADMVLFPTAAMQEMVAQCASLDGRRTEVIHYGLDHDAFARDGGAKPEIVQRMADWKDGRYQLLLSVSSYAIHKNIETLIEALPYLLDQGLKPKLITTLSREKTSDKVEYDLLMRRVMDLGLEDTVVQTGDMPYESLARIYQAADLFVFPSFTESFGQPLVEAMASGLPIVASDTATNREVCGAAGSYFATFDARDCARVIMETLADVEKLDVMRQRAAERSRAFSWQAYAEKLVSLLESL